MITPDVLEFPPAKTNLHHLFSEHGKITWGDLAANFLGRWSFEASREWGSRADGGYDRSPTVNIHELREAIIGISQAYHRPAGRALVRWH